MSQIRQTSIDLDIALDSFDVRAPVSEAKQRLSLIAHPSSGRRLWAAQRIVLSLFCCDLVVALATVTILMSEAGPLASLSKWMFLGWAILWLVTTGVLGGFSVRRETALSAGVIIRAGAATAVIGTAVTLLVVRSAELGTLFLLTAGMTVGGLICRIVYRRLSTVTVVMVTSADAGLPKPSPPGVAIRHLALADDAIGDGERLISRIREAVVDYDACCVELTGTLGLSDEQLQKLSWVLREQHASLRISVFRAQIRQSRIHPVSDSTRVAVEVSAPQQPLLGRAAKRVADLSGAAMLIAFLSPLLATLAILVKMSSPGPAFYRQERVGRDGAMFDIFKFRSMVADADDQLKGLLAQQKRNNRPLFKVDNDPRVTRIGAIMRRYSLDELPQLFNVFGGTMSLVGPRPQRAEEVALYSGNASQRLGVAPGMTGLWQVSGRSRLTWEEAQRLDLFYAHNWTIWLDFRILAQTIRAVVGGDGAC